MEVESRKARLAKPLVTRILRLPGVPTTLHTLFATPCLYIDETLYKLKGLNTDSRLFQSYAIDAPPFYRDMKSLLPPETKQ